MRPNKSVSKLASLSPSTPAPPTQQQQALGVALAGGAITTPLLLALLDKVLSFEETHAICRRAREIAIQFDNLPEGKFALACIDDFLMARSLSEPNTDEQSPTLVPSQKPDDPE
jgi:hypothetical protein